MQGLGLPREYKVDIGVPVVGLPVVVGIVPGIFPIQDPAPLVI